MSFDLRWNYRDRDIEYVEVFFGHFPGYMHLPGPRFQLVDVFVRDNHRGWSVSQFPYPEAPDDGVSDPGFFVVKSSHPIHLL